MSALTLNGTFEHHECKGENILSNGGPTTSDMHCYHLNGLSNHLPKPLSNGNTADLLSKRAACSMDSHIGTMAAYCTQCKTAACDRCMTAQHYTHVEALEQYCLIASNLVNMLSALRSKSHHALHLHSFSLSHVDVDAGRQQLQQEIADRYNEVRERLQTEKDKVRRRIRQSRYVARLKEYIEGTMQGRRKIAGDMKAECKCEIQKLAQDELHESCATSLSQRFQVLNARRRELIALNHTLNACITTFHTKLQQLGEISAGYAASSAQLGTFCPSLQSLAACPPDELHKGTQKTQENALGITKDRKSVAATVVEATSDSDVRSTQPDRTANSKPILDGFLETSANGNVNGNGEAKRKGKDKNKEKGKGKGREKGREKGNRDEHEKGSQKGNGTDDVNCNGNDQRNGHGKESESQTQNRIQSGRRSKSGDAELDEDDETNLKSGPEAKSSPETENESRSHVPASPENRPDHEGALSVEEVSKSSTVPLPTSAASRLVLIRYSQRLLVVYYPSLNCARLQRLQSNFECPLNYSIADLGDEHICLIGGNVPRSCGPLVCIPSVWEISPTTGQVRALASLQTARRRAAVAVVSNKLVFAIGGDNETTVLNTCERYETTTGRWDFAPSLNESKTNTSVGAFNDTHLYVFGGYTRDLVCTAAVEKLRLGKSHWKSVSLASLTNWGPIQSTGVVQIGPDQVLVWGGMRNGRMLANSIVYRVSQRTFESAGNLGTSDTFLQLKPIVNTGHVYSFSCHRHDVHIFDIGSNTWTLRHFQSLPTS